MNLIEQTDILDCIVEVSYLQEKVSKFTDEDLISKIVAYIEVDLGEKVDKAILRFFEMGVLTPEDRQAVESCYVLLDNVFCWGEPEEGNAAVYQTVFRS